MKTRLCNPLAIAGRSAPTRWLSFARARLGLGATKAGKGLEEAVETAVGVLAVFLWLAAMTLLP